MLLSYAPNLLVIISFVFFVTTSSCNTGYIGLVRTGPFDSFFWLDGSNSSYRSWSSGQPEQSNQVPANDAHPDQSNRHAQFVAFGSTEGREWQSVGLVNSKFPGVCERISDRKTVESCSKVQSCELCMQSKVTTGWVHMCASSLNRNRTQRRAFACQFCTTRMERHAKPAKTCTALMPESTWNVVCHGLKIHKQRQVWSQGKWYTSWRNAMTVLVSGMLKLPPPMVFNSAFLLILRLRHRGSSTSSWLLASPRLRFETMTCTVESSPLLPGYRTSAMRTSRRAFRKPIQEALKTERVILIGDSRRHILHSQTRLSMDHEPETFGMLYQSRNIC